MWDRFPTISDCVTYSLGVRLFDQEKGQWTILSNQKIYCVPAPFQPIKSNKQKSNGAAVPFGSRCPVRWAPSVSSGPKKVSWSTDRHRSKRPHFHSSVCSGSVPKLDRSSERAPWEHRIGPERKAVGNPTAYIPSRLPVPG